MATAEAQIHEHLAFQRAETRKLRALNGRLAHELALTRRLLASFLPETAGPRWPAVMAAVRLPEAEFAAAEGDLRFAVDNLDRGQTHTRLRGWAFAPGLTDGAETVITLLFVPVSEGTAAVTHAVATEVQVRPDVAAAFVNLCPAPTNLDRAGFVTTVFHPSLMPGEYELFIHVAQPGVGAARRAAGVRLAF